MFPVDTIPIGLVVPFFAWNWIVSSLPYKYVEIIEQYCSDALALWVYRNLHFSAVPTKWKFCVIANDIATWFGNTSSFGCFEWLILSLHLIVSWRKALSFRVHHNDQYPIFIPWSFHPQKTSSWPLRRLILRIIPWIVKTSSEDFQGWPSTNPCRWKYNRQWSPVMEEHN